VEVGNIELTTGGVGQHLVMLLKDLVDTLGDKQRGDSKVSRRH
jgi:hypothetical protein